MTDHAERPRPLPAHPRRRRPRRTADRDPLRDPARRHAPDLHARHPARPRRQHDQPGSPPAPTCTSACCSAAAAPAAATPASAPTSRSSRSTAPTPLERLAQYRCPPTMVIASGGTPGHAHAYWQLQQPVEPRRARASQPATRDPPRRRPRLRRRRPHPQTANLVEQETHPADPRRAARAPTRPAATRSPSSPPASPTPPRHRGPPSAGHARADQRARPAAARDPRRHLRAGAHRPPAQPRRQNPSAPSTTTTTPASSSTTTTGTATEPAAPAAPSTTSARFSTASAPAAADFLELRQRLADRAVAAQVRFQFER